MPARAWLAALAQGALDLVFAPVCLACGGAIPATVDERLVCGPCWSKMRTVPLPRCDRCWAPRPPSTHAPAGCASCATLPPAVRVVRSAFVLEGPAQSLVHALKYRGWHAAAAPMARRMAELPLPLDVVEEAHSVVPVPTSAARMRERGYNQAEALARALAEATGRTLDAQRLRRIRASATQTALHPSERRANVAGAFAALPASGRGGPGEHVLLVDDVWTTGATAVACATALLSQGARVVSVLTFARALPELNRGVRR